MSLIVYIILIVLLALPLISFILSPSGPSNRGSELSSYECGLEPMGDAKIKFALLYYIIGILYLLFDLEVVFLYPLAASMWLLNNYIAFIAIMCFVILLCLTFIYEWFVGALAL